MKPLIRNLFAIPFLGASLGASAAPYLVPNGDFSIAAGENWNEAAESAGTIFSYEASGGSVDNGGFAQIDNSAGGAWAVLIHEGGTGPAPIGGGGIPISSLGSSGLIAGENYTFSIDIIDLDPGATMAGLKMESWSETGLVGASVETLFSVTDSWATYSFDYTIDPAATRLKFVPVITGGDMSAVGFDNVGGEDTPVEVTPDQIENGNFEIPNGASWGTTQGTPSFLTTDGNPNGHVVLDGTSGFTVLYAFNNTEKTFASLGLEPGDTYVVQMDMKLISGLFSGGLRLEGPSGYVEEYYPTVIGNGSEWETYTIELTVPQSPGQAKFGLRPGGSVIAFDNVSIGEAPAPVEVPFCVNLAQGSVVSWNPTSSTSSYQPQASNDNMTWTNLGGPIIGDAVNSLFVDDNSSFYRVEESTTNSIELLDDPSFETGSFAWTFNGQGVVEDVFSSALAFAGDYSLRVSADAGPTGLATAAVLQQSTGIGSVVPGDILDFSYQVFIESNNGAVMNSSVRWIGSDQGVISQVDTPIQTLPTGVWTEVSAPNLVAPAGTDSVLLQFYCITGAVAGHEGSYRLDEVSLTGQSSMPVGTLPATQTEGMQISWETQNGFSYQLMSSPDLNGFTNFGSAMIGDGSTMTVGDTAAERKFYQVVETPSN